MEGNDQNDDYSGIWIVCSFQLGQSMAQTRYFFCSNFCKLQKRA